MLSDNGSPQSLTVLNALNIGYGWLQLNTDSSVTAGADSFNAGMIDLHGASASFAGSLQNAGRIDLFGATTSVTGNLDNPGELTSTARRFR